MPDEVEVLGLLALLLLTESRRAARTAADGSLVLLADQDGSVWDRALIREGQALVRSCLRRNHPGPYQVQAAINAVHSDAAAAPDTDWRQILRFYDQLLTFAPTQVGRAEPCRCKPKSTGRRPRRQSPKISTSTTTTCTTPKRAELLRRLGRYHDAADGYDAALSLTPTRPNASSWRNAERSSPADSSPETVTTRIREVASPVAVGTFKGNVGRIVAVYHDDAFEAEMDVDGPPVSCSPKQRHRTRADRHTETRTHRDFRTVLNITMTLAAAVEAVFAVLAFRPVPPPARVGVPLTSAVIGDLSTLAAATHPDPQDPRRLLSNATADFRKPRHAVSATGSPYEHRWAPEQEGGVTAPR